MIKRKRIIEIRNMFDNHKNSSGQYFSEMPHNDIKVTEYELCCYLVYEIEHKVKDTTIAPILTFKKKGSLVIRESTISKGLRFFHNIFFRISNDSLKEYFEIMSEKEILEKCRKYISVYDLHEKLQNIIPNKTDFRTKRNKI